MTIWNTILHGADQLGAVLLTTMQDTRTLYPLTRRHPAVRFGKGVGLQTPSQSDRRERGSDFLNDLKSEHTSWADA